MKRAALFVGVNDYCSPITPLAYARRDATTLFNFFLRTGSYQPIEVIATDATDRKMLDAVKAMMKDLEPGDLFLFYFSGHGVEDRGEHILLGEDAQQYGSYWTGGLSFNLLKEITRKPGVQSVFIIDSCRNDLFTGHRGISIGSESHARSVTLSALQREPKTEGFLPPVVLCSCSSGEQAFEVPDLEQGVFSKVLVDYLTTATDFSIEAIANGMVPGIQALLRRHHLNGKQTPELHKPLNCTVHLLDPISPATPKPTPAPAPEPEPIPNPSFDDPLEVLLYAAERGNIEAQLILGYRYAHEEGAPKNDVEAAKWYRKAAEQGDAVAQNQLGEHYQYGKGVTQSYEEALKWYRKAVVQDDADAQLNLGFCYNKGYGVAQNLLEAARWYRKSAEQGNAVAQYNLGVFYENGHGVPQDIVEAVQWYRKAAKQGDVDAQSTLGRFYQFGQGVDKDCAEAVKWYRKAAKQGDAIAQNNLGCCYQHGEGVSQDFVKAAQWYLKAAEQGHVLAQSNLGNCYEHGLGVARDKALAIAWYRNAAEQGNENAQEALQRLTSKSVFRRLFG